MKIMTTGKVKIQEIFAIFRAKDIFEKMNLLSFAFLCLFLLDCCIMGGGRYFNICGITFRMMLGIGCLVFSAPSLLKDWRTTIKQPVNLLIVPFVIWFVICAIRGIVEGNNYEVLVSDVKGFLYLFLVPVSVNCVRGKKRIRTIMNVILLGATIQALLILGINLYCELGSANWKDLYQPLMDIHLGTISNISGIYRIFMRSSPYLIVASVIAIYRQLENERLKVSYIIITAIYLFSLLLSFTRSLYGSFFVTATVIVFVVLIVCPKQIGKTIKHLMVSAVVTLVLITAGEVVFEANYFNFAIARTLGTEVKESPASKLRGNIRKLLAGKQPADDNTMDEDDDIITPEEYLEQTRQSDELRRITKKELIELFQAKPIVGHGLGAFAPSRNGPDEYFYLDVLARMGIIGMVLYVLPYIYIFVVATKKKSVLLTACLCLPFWLATNFNPWMNAAIGISCYAITVTAAAEEFRLHIRQEGTYGAM